MAAFVEFKDVKKTYKMGETEIHALNGADFEINKGEFCVIVGASGAGKTQFSTFSAEWIPLQAVMLSLTELIFLKCQKSS